MKNSKIMLISSSSDKDCRLWNIAQGNCLKIFKGHSDIIRSIQILSEQIFVSASAEILFWNINSTNSFRCIQPDQSGSEIFSLIKNDKNELIFTGEQSFIGLIKI